ncbi:transglutaminase-like cysteine peptidase [Oryzicola mucosus]|uniref:Transglutaminase-like cysteine peptidase n=1 Tax=Oryzicola mucosus TaxID=2767425 RepID=A0A8J6U1W4_9HYPH|nr:transglutaminase-like cysteine peptidase [Oryzicola mucosus]MBD0414988.1 transglutaminase-like cysteine peptidase [Oryzicola mucosus]
MKTLFAGLVFGLQLFAAGQAFADASFMQTMGRTTQPVGHYDFCQRERGECSQKTPSKAPVQLTRSLWAKIVEVNNTVNMAIEPRTDMELWGQEEVWSFPVNMKGDCEDYVLEKRRRLMKLGVPAGSLLITVVRQPSGDGHAVLTVRSDLGEFILDNLESRVLAWHETDYTYLKRQSETNSGVWIGINDGRADAVASVR